MYRLEELVSRLGGELIGDGSTPVRRVATLEGAGPEDIAFLANSRYASRLAACAAAAVIVAPWARDKTSRARIVVDDPYLYYARVAQLFHPPELPPVGVDLSARIESALPESVIVGPGASIAADVMLGEHVVVGPGCHIGRGSRLGRHTRLHANVTIYHDCVIGNDCIIHSGAVIGSDGFGFARQGDGTWVKIPQVGRVVIGDDVEVGANTTIDRGAIEDTVIGNGVKLDNQIQIAHNVRVGDRTAIAGCVGIAGSTTIGERCMIGGQAGIIGHLRIADDVVISAGTLVTKSVTRAGVYTANLPLQEHAQWVRNFAHLRHLDALSVRIRRLEELLDDRKVT